MSKFKTGDLIKYKNSHFTMKINSVENNCYILKSISKSKDRSYNKRNIPFIDNQCIRSIVAIFKNL